MSQLRAHARIVVLSGATILLGAWNLAGLPTAPTPEPPPSGPASEPSSLAAGDDRAAAAPDGGRSVALPGHVAATPAGEDAAVVAAPAPAAGPREAEVAVVPAQGRPDVALCLLLDQVFGPDRFGRGQDASQVASIPEPAPADPAAAGPEQQAGAGSIASESPAAVPADPGADHRDDRPRPESERASYADFLALAKQDPQELLRQADAVLGGSGENCRKVAMLRVLYDTDRAQALDYFARAISSLPDRPAPEGVSVPAFAVDFLARHLADATVKGLVERMAWNGYLNLSPELQRSAADALLASATAADLQRYAAYPAYQDLTLVAGSEVSP